MAKRKKKAKKRRTRRVKKAPKKRRRSMARRGRRKRRSGKAKSIPIAPLVPAMYAGYSAFKTYGLSETALADLMAKTTGYNPQVNAFNTQTAMPFWMGSIAGIVVHKVANRTGINNYIRRATMGYLSL